MTKAAPSPSWPDNPGFDYFAFNGITAAIDSVGHICAHRVQTPNTTSITITPNISSHLRHRIYPMEASIQEETLQAIVNRLVESVHPDKIILFGSRASGSAQLSSDFDLMIVGPSPDPRHRRLKPAYDALWGIRAPIDLLWYTPEEVDQV